MIVRKKSLHWIIRVKITRDECPNEEKNWITHSPPLKEKLRLSTKEEDWQEANKEKNTCALDKRWWVFLVSGRWQLMGSSRGSAIVWLSPTDDLSSGCRWFHKRIRRENVDDEISGSEQPNLRQSRERLAGRLVSKREQSGRSESCAYPKLSDSRLSVRRAPVVPRVAAHVPSREKPTTDCHRSSFAPDGVASGCRWERCQGKVDGGEKAARKEGTRVGQRPAETQGAGVRMSN